eukprot:TRINITY_DN5734_c0_g2_i2.p2 TRINITY_DN5734_c0_g2~~TRINITY_DN5734_c0_g2_i2.p2  ORF type:complete len:184 (-),score=39.63 TRINITY_DN5734_c0_g2_i2:153-704(-)
MKYFVLFLWVTSIDAVYIIALSTSYVFLNIFASKEIMERAAAYFPLGAIGIFLGLIGIHLALYLSLLTHRDTYYLIATLCKVMAIIGLGLVLGYLGISYGFDDFRVTPVAFGIVVYTVGIAAWIMPIAVSYIDLAANGLTEKEVMAMYREGVELPKYGMADKCRNVKKLLVATIPKSELMNSL